MFEVSHTQLLADSNFVLNCLDTNWLLLSIGILTTTILIIVIVMLCKLISAVAKTKVVPAPNDGLTRGTLAQNVITFSLIGIVLLALSVLFASAKGIETAKFVFGAVLPLLASWVGTVLAYYFSRENLAAATLSVATLADRLTPDQKLKSISVQNKMRPLIQIKYHIVDPQDDGKISLTVLKADGVERIIILNKNESLRYLIYKSKIDEFLAKFADKNQALPAGKTLSSDLTLQELIADADLKKLFETSWATVAKDATLADAKLAMERNGRNCNDVFVTATGQRTEPILGWITDNILAENSKV